VQIIGQRDGLVACMLQTFLEWDLATIRLERLHAPFDIAAIFLVGPQVTVLPEVLLSIADVAGRELDTALVTAFSELIVVVADLSIRVV
jgi:hypothetical protein